jgi:glycosyltransferase involved in cell wall biosynthesis
MNKTLILVDPDYQFGFEGFLQECNSQGMVVGIGNNKLSFGYNIKSWTSWLSTFISRSALWVPSYYQLKKIIKEHDIQRVHVIGEPTYLSVFIVSWIKLVNRFKHISITCRVAQNLPFKLPLPFAITLRLARKMDVKVFPVSELSAKFALSFYKIDVLDILPNGVPEEFYLQERSNEKKNIVLFVGHFNERKGFSDFLCLCQMIKEQFGDKYKFVAIGGNSKTAISEINYIYPYIEFIEWIPREQLIEFYDRAICLIMPSKKTSGKDLPLSKRLFKTVPWMEQFGRVIVESYSRGTPVIAYNSGAIGEYLLDSKCLIREGDVASMLEAFCYISSAESKINQHIEYSRDFKWSLIFKRFWKIRASI